MVAVSPVSGTIVFSGSALTALLSGPAGPVGRDLARRANAVRSAAVGFCPVDTGRLRASIRWSLVRDAQGGSRGVDPTLGLAAIVGSDVHYAAYVEYGTRFMAPRSFLRPALAAAGY